MSNLWRFSLVAAATGILFPGLFHRNPIHGDPQATGGPEAQPPAVQAAAEDDWPRKITSGDKTFVIHQPQFDSWDGHGVEVLAAIEVRTEGQDKVLYGAARATASANVDKTTRVVELADVKVIKAAFPSIPDKEESYLKLLQDNVIPKVRRISLDSFETALAAMEAEHKFRSYPLKNDPPAIIQSTVPAILVYIDGPPSYRPDRTGWFARIVNTRPLILKDQKKFYLRIFDGWMEAEAYKGPWQVCKKPPKQLADALKDAIGSGQVDLLEGKADPESKLPPASLSQKPVPVIHIATTPTELIVTQGEPKFVSIPGTTLAYAENTTGHLFKDTVENKLYVLISGRWFCAKLFWHRNSGKVDNVALSLSLVGRGIHRPTMCKYPSIFHLRQKT